MSDLSSEPLPNATGPRPLFESNFRSFMRGRLVHVVGQYADLMRQSPVAALVALKVMARELSEADLRDLDCRAAT
jgi:hypothetical protein